MWRRKRAKPMPGWSWHSPTPAATLARSSRSAWRSSTSPSRRCAFRCSLDECVALLSKGLGGADGLEPTWVGLRTRAGRLEQRPDLREAALPRVVERRAALAVCDIDVGPSTNQRRDDSLMPRPAVGKDDGFQQ